MASKDVSGTTASAVHIQFGTRHFAVAPIPTAFVEANNVRLQEIDHRPFFILVLDRSGSMYSDYDVARQAVIDTVDKLHQGGVADIGVIIFESETVQKASWDVSVDALKKWTMNIRCGGGTDIPNALSAVGELVAQCTQKYPDASLQGSVVFFTDGEDCSGQRVMSCRGINNIKQMLGSDTLSVTFHCIGFGASHDAKLLGQMTQIGTSEGTFQYVGDRSQISSALENLGCAQCPAFVRMEVETSTRRTFDVSGIQSVTFELAEAEVSEPLTLRLRGGDETVTMELRGIGDEVSEQGARLVVETTELALRDLLRQANSGGPVDEALVREAEAIDTTLLRLHASALKLPREQRDLRRQLVTLIMGARQLAIQLKTIIGDMRRGERVSNERIAAWQDLSYRSTVLKGRDRRKLADRVQSNAAKLEEIEEQIQKLVLETDIDKIQVDRDLLQTTVCMLSRATMLEAMAEGDCICLGLDVRRSAGCIHDPSKLRIRSVGPTFVTGQTFMDILATELEASGNGYVQFGDDADDDDGVGDGMFMEKSPETAHAGFDPQQKLAKVFPGLATESVTAVLPLFLHKKHWDIAFKRSKALLSFATTLDVAGGSGQEIATVPFLVLFHLVKMHLRQCGRSENVALMYRLVLETCMAIYEVKPFDLKARIQSLLQEFLGDPAKRLPESVSSMEVFLGQVLCAVISGDVKLEDGQKLFQYCAEELLRRSVDEIDKVKVEGELVEVPELGNTLEMFSVLGLDLGKVASSSMKQWKSEEEQAILKEEESHQMDLDTYALAFNTEQDTEALHFRHEFKPCPEAQVSSSEIQMSPGLKALSDRLFKVTNADVRTLKGLVDLMDKRGKIEDIDLSESDGFLDAMSPFTRLALVIQSKMQSSNSSRKNALAAGAYTPEIYASEEAAQDFFNKFMKATIDKKSKTLMRAHRDELTAKANARVAAKFLATQNLDEAAGLTRLYCRFRGVQCFHAFISVLQANHPIEAPTEDRPWDLAKLRMLVTGVYKGKRLFKDSLEGPAPKEDRSLPSRNHWRPTRKNVYRILCYFHQMPCASADELCELFPTFTTYIKPFFDKL